MKEIKLFEGSDVAFGANELTPMLGTKSAEEKSAYAVSVVDRIEKMEKMLRDGTLTDEGFIDLEIEMNQLKQSVINLAKTEPSMKDTILENARPDTQKEKNSSTSNFLYNLCKNSE